MNFQSTSLKIIVRKARLQDSDRIFQIQTESLKVLSADDYSPEQIQCLVDNKADLNNISSRNIVKAFVAEIDGEIIGFSSLGFWTINAMFVHPNFTRQGVGRKLLEAIEQEALSRRWKVLTVMASITGQPFYQACGYRNLFKSSITLCNQDFKMIEIPGFSMEKWLVVPEDWEKLIWDGWMTIGKMTQSLALHS